MFSDDEVERYARHLVLRELGGPGQQRLKAARVALVDGPDGDDTLGSAPMVDGSARQGGGHVVAIPGGTPNARGLARAAIALDAESCRSIVGETLDRRGVVWTWATSLRARPRSGVSRRQRRRSSGRAPRPSGSARTFRRRGSR